MEIYEQIAFSGQILILFKSIVLLIALFLAGYFILPRKSSNFFLLFANGIGFSLIFLSSIFASFYTYGHSVLIPLAALFFSIAIITIKNRRYRRIDLKRFFDARIGGFLLLFILLFSLNSFITQPYDEQGIVVINSDISTYSNWSRNMMNSAAETLPLEIFNDESKQTSYHFIDLWFVGWGSEIFNINSYVFYSLVYKPLLQFTLVLFILGFARKFNLSKRIQILAIFIFFSTALYPYLSSKSNPWYLDFSAQSFPLYHYIGTYFVSVYFFIILSAFLFYKNEALAIILASLLATVNPLFLAIVPLFYLTILTTDFFKNRIKIFNYINIVNEQNRWLYLLGFVISFLLAGFFTMFIVGNEGRDTIDIFRFKTYLVAGDLFMRTIVVSLAYFPVSIVGYVYIIKYYRNYRPIYLFFLHVFIAGAVFMSLVYENIQSDIKQIIIILWNFPLITLGSLGFLLLTSRAEKYKSALVMVFVFNSLWGVYNTFSEKYSSFHPVYRFNHIGTYVQYKNIDKLSEIIEKYGYLGGYFRNPTSETRALTLSDFITLNAFTKDYSNSYRLNVLDFDELNHGGNRIYKRTLLYDLSKNNTSGKESIELVRKMDVNWLVVDNDKFYFPPELKSIFVKEYKFDEFTVFVKPKE